MCQYANMPMRETTPNIILDLSFNLALEVINFTELLQKEKKYNLANQLFRSGTSIGANIYEAQSCESRADFIHKMKLAAKEAEETKYWLTLCLKSEYYPDPGTMLEKLQIIIKILTKIIASSKQVKA